MSYFGDTLAHSSLLGITLALLLEINITLAITGGVFLLGTIMWLKWFPESKLGQRLATQQTIGKVDYGMDDLVGKRGTTKSPLRPYGIAVIDGKRMDVSAVDEFMEPETQIEVVKVQGNRVMVRSV